MSRNEISARRVVEAVVFGILESGTMCVLDGSLSEHIGHLVEQHSTDAKSPEDYLLATYSRERSKLLDYGCGTAEHRPMLEKMGYQWHGINFQGGMQHDAAEAAMCIAGIEFYDGNQLPYSDQYFDVVYSTFVFQCVQNIEVAFSEIKRVLKPGGLLIGSVAYMEQMQDYTTFNFTPYGFKICV